MGGGISFNRMDPRTTVDSGVYTFRNDTPYDPNNPASYPFQFEIGVADLSIGVVAVLSFWRSLSFKAAVVLYVVLFNIGVAIGHVRQAVVNADYAPDNFGLLLLLTVIKIPLLAWLLWKAHEEQGTAVKAR